MVSVSSSMFSWVIATLPKMKALPVVLCVSVSFLKMKAMHLFHCCLIQWLLMSKN